MASNPQDPYASLLSDTSPDTDPFDLLDQEFQQTYGRPLAFTGRDTETHVRLHGKNQARDIRVRDLDGDQIKFILNRGPELGLNLRDYSRAKPHTTKTGVRITGPHIHSQRAKAGKTNTDLSADPYAAILSSQPLAASDTDPYAAIFSGTTPEAPAVKPTGQPSIVSAVQPVTGAPAQIEAPRSPIAAPQIQTTPGQPPTFEPIQSPAGTGVEISLGEYLKSGQTPKPEELGRLSYQGLGFSDSEAQEFTKQLLNKPNATPQEVASTFYQTGGAEGEAAIVERAKQDTMGRVMLRDLQPHASDAKRVWLETHRAEVKKQEEQTAWSDYLESLRKIRPEYRKDEAIDIARNRELTPEEREILLGERGVIRKTIGSLAEGASSVIGNAMTYAGNVLSQIPAPPPEMGTVEEGYLQAKPLEGLGQATAEAGSELTRRAEVYGRVTGLEEGMPRDVVRGIGGSLPFLPTGALGAGGRIAAGVLGWATNAGQIYEEGKAAGLNHDQALVAAHTGGPSGLLEMWGIGGTLDRIGRQVLIGTFIRTTLREAGEEATQEAVQQVLNNLTAKGFYDPKRGAFKGVGYSALIAGITGGAIGGGAHAAARGVEKISEKAPAKTGINLLESQPGRPSGRPGIGKANADDSVETVGVVLPVDNGTGRGVPKPQTKGGDAVGRKEMPTIGPEGPRSEEGSSPDAREKGQQQETVLTKQGAAENVAPNPKVLGHVAGPSGAGKTELANALGKSGVKNIALIDLDAFDEAAVKHLGYDKIKKDDFTDAMLAEVHDERQKIVDKFIEKSRKPVVFFGHHIEGDNSLNLHTDNKILLDVPARTAALRANKRPGKIVGDITRDTRTGEQDIAELKAQGYQATKPSAAFGKILQFSKAEAAKTKAGEVIAEEPARVVGTEGIVKRARENERRAQAEAEVDTATGLQSKNSWVKAQPRIDADLNQEVAVLDVNDLKKFNDSISHQAGDEYLAHVGKVVREEAEKAGISPRQVFRTGGDEVVFAAPKGKAQAVVEKIKTRVAKFERNGIKGSIAGGVGQATKIADAQMFADKRRMKETAGRAAIVQQAKAKAAPTMTPQGAGVSNEELSRTGTFYKVSRSGQLTYMGKQADATLKSGEATVYRTGAGELQTYAGDPSLVGKYGANIERAVNEGKLVDRRKNAGAAPATGERRYVHRDFGEVKEVGRQRTRRIVEDAQGERHLVKPQADNQRMIPIKAEPQAATTEKKPEAKPAKPREAFAAAVKARLPQKLLQKKEPWQQTQDEFFKSHSTGEMPGHAYDEHEEPSELDARNKRPILVKTIQVDGRPIELRQTRHDRSIVAYDGERPIALLADDLDTPDVWVEKAFRRKGIGTAMLRAYIGQRTVPSLGKVTKDGRALVRALHKNIVADAVAQGKPVPISVLADYPDLQKNQLFQKKDTPLLSAIRRAGGIDPNTSEGRDIARYFSKKEGGQGLMIQGGAKVDQLVRALRDEDGFPFREEDDPLYDPVGELINAMQQDAEGRPFRSYEDLGQDFEDETERYLAEQQGLDNVEDFRIINSLGSKTWFDLYEKVVNEATEPTAEEVTQFRKISGAIKLSPGGIESIIEFGKAGRSESATEFFTEDDRNAVARERAALAAEKESQLSDYDKIPLPTEVKDPLLAIARKFFRDKRTDYDALAQQYQDALGEDYILVADHLPVIFAHAEPVEKEVAKNLSDLKTVITMPSNAAELEGGPLTESELNWIAERRRRDAESEESRKIAKEARGAGAYRGRALTKAEAARRKSARTTEAIPGITTAANRGEFKAALIKNWRVDPEVAHRASEIMEALASQYAVDAKASDPKVDTAAAKRSVYERVKVASGAATGETLQQGKAQTETPEFKKWFGDSKVVDESGEPLVVYHGTNRDFDEFDPNTQSEGSAGRGFYFSEHPQIAADSGDIILPVYLRISNPATFAQYRATGFDRAKLIEQGFDGIRLKNAGEWVAFENTQIKSATGNRGTFDPSSANILKQEAFGATSFTKTGEAIIHGFEANPSTAPHEIVHATLPLIADLANQPNAPVSLKIAVRDIVQSAGFKDTAEYLRQHQAWVSETGSAEDKASYREGSEKAARGFEGYLREGKAPTKALESAFAKFKEWLSQIYRRIREDMQLTDRQRRAWDRLLGSEREKAHAENGDTRPGVDVARVAQVRTRATPGTLREYGIGAADSTYYVKPNAVAVQSARDLIEEHGAEGALRIWEADKVASAESTATGMALISEFLRKAENSKTVGDTKEAKAFREQAGRVIDELSARQTAAGQTVQATNTVASFAPERVVLAARKIKKRRNQSLTDSEIEKGDEIAKRVGEKEKAVANIEGEIADRRAVKKKEKPQNWQTRLARMEADTRARLGLQTKPESSLLYQEGPSDEVILGAAKLARKINRQDWEAEMVADFGEGIRPTLDAVRRQSAEMIRDLRREDREMKEPASRSLLAETYDEIRDLQREQAEAIRAEEREARAFGKQLATEARGQKREAIEAEKQRRKEIATESTRRAKEAQAQLDELDKAAAGPARERITRERQAERAELQDFRDEMKRQAVEARERASEASDIGREIAVEARTRLVEENRQKRDARAAEAAANRERLKELRKEEAILQTAEFKRIREERAETKKAQTLNRQWDAGIKRDAAANPTDQVAAGAEMLLTPTRVFDWQRSMRQRFGADFKDAPGVFAQAYENVKAARSAARVMSRTGRSPEAFSDAQIEELENRRRTAIKEAQQARTELANYFEDLGGGWGRRAFRTLVDLAGVPRSTMTSYDLSAAGRQALPISLAHPQLAAEAFKTQAEALVSQAKSEDVTEWLATHPRRASALRNGLALGSLTGERPEQFASRMAEKIPGVKQSQRAYVAYLDTIRMLFYDYIATQHEQAFKFNEDTNPKFYRDLAKLANLSSGRGEIPKFLESAATLLNNTFFSIRLWSSRVELAFPVRFITAEPNVRRLAYKDLFKTYSAMTGLIAIAAALGAQVEWDPDDPDFLYARFGNTRYDLTGGIRGPLKFAGRLVQAAVRKAQGRESEGRGLGDIILQEGRNKLAPVPGAAVSAWMGRKPTGEETTTKDEALGLITPMVGRDAYEGWKDAGGTDILKWARGEEKQFKTGFAGAAKTGLPAFFGISTQTYKERIPTDVRQVLRGSGKSFNRPRQKNGESAADYKARVEKEDTEAVSDIRTLILSEEFKNASREKRNEMLKLTIGTARREIEMQRKRKSESEIELSTDRTTVRHRVIEKLKEREDFKALDDESQDSVIDKVNGMFHRLDIKKEDKGKPDVVRRKLQMLDDMQRRGTFDSEIRDIMRDLPRKAA